MNAGNAYFPSYGKVESLTVKLINSINEKAKGASTDKDKIELSFAAHFNLVSIHPFYDGNWRTSRLLMIYFQKKFDLPMAIVFKEDKNEYFTALQDARKNN
jgi:Fic family protein